MHKLENGELTIKYSKQTLQIDAAKSILAEFVTITL
jgi:hypothetical protein